MLIYNLKLKEKVKEKEGEGLQKCSEPPEGKTKSYVEYCAPWRHSLWRSHLLDDGLVGAVVLAQQDATGVLGRVVLVQPV